MLDEQVVLVSGLPRSGTSMMMRMLKAGGVEVLTDKIRQPDTHNPNGYFEYEPTKTTKDDSSWLSEAQGRATKMVYRLLYDLPPVFKYLVIFMRRNIDEILASQSRMLQSLEKTGGQLSDDRLKRLFLDEIARFKSWSVTQPNFSVLYLDYGDILKSPDSSISRVDSFLGGGLDVNAMQDTIDPSLYRNRSN